MVEGNTSPTITVAIPVYNGAATIGHAIESVLRQTYPHFELHVFDNCSTDNTREVVAKYDDERISVFPASEHVPLAASWNRCFAHAQGEFFQLMCADDLLAEECFAAKIAAAAKPENADACLFTSNRMIIGRNGRQLFSVGLGKQPVSLSLPELLLRTTSVLNPIGDPNAGLVRTRALDGFSFSSKYSFLADMELWLHVLQQGSLQHIPQDLSYFRIAGTTLSGSRMMRNLAESVRFYRDRIKPGLSARKIRYLLGYPNLGLRGLGRGLIYLLCR